jgi:hypothetical protein
VRGNAGAGWKVQQSAGPRSEKVQRATWRKVERKHGTRDSGAVKDAIHCAAWKAGTLGKQSRSRTRGLLGNG